MDCQYYLIIVAKPKQLDMSQFYLHTDDNMLSHLALLKNTMHM